MRPGPPQAAPGLAAAPARAAAFSALQHGLGYDRGMALHITDICINCDVCEPVCPNQAIYQGETIYEIDPTRCTECVGHHPEPQCQAVCPVECCLPDPDQVESRGELLAKLDRLTKEAVS